MATSNSALGNVQELYVMQVELWKYLDARALDAEERKQAKKTLKEFGSLLRQVDWRYMGGEDVLQTLEHMHKEAARKVGAAASKKDSAPKKMSVKVSTKKTAVAKKVTKKPAAKKKKK